MTSSSVSFDGSTKANVNGIVVPAKRDFRRDVRPRMNGDERAVSCRWDDVPQYEMYQ